MKAGKIYIPTAANLCVKAIMILPTSEHMGAFLGNNIFRLIFLTSWWHASRFAIYTKTNKQKNQFPPSGFSLHNCKGKDYMKLQP